MSEDVREWFETKLTATEQLEFRKKHGLTAPPQEDLDEMPDCSDCAGTGNCDYCYGDGTTEHYCDCPFCYETEEDCDNCEEGKCDTCDGTGKDGS